MKRRVIGASSAVIFIVGMAAGYAVATGLPLGSPSRSTCMQTGIHGSLFVRVVSDESKTPIEGARVQATILNYCSPSFGLSLGDTNASGYTPASLYWTGVFLINVTYPLATQHSTGTTYVFLSQTSGSISLATLYIPSGEVVEAPIACYGLGCSNSTTTSVANIM